jgi:hypothetical protein
VNVCCSPLPVSHDSATKSREEARRKNKRMNTGEDAYREKNPETLLSHDISMRKSSRTSRPSRLNLSSDALFNMRALAFGIQRVGIRRNHCAVGGAFSRLMSRFSMLSGRM